MLRTLHKIPGLFAALLIIVLATSGAVLSVLPALEKAQTAAEPRGLSVAVLADRIAIAYPGVEQIRRAPSGQITAFYFDAGQPGAAVIDPQTGRGIAPYDRSTFERWMTTLHRSLFLDDTGRIAAALGAGSLLLLSLSGLMLTLRRLGGWSRLFSRLRGPLMGRLHVEVARATVLGLLLSSVTALYMVANTFDLLPHAQTALFPNNVSGTQGVIPGTVPTLLDTPLADLRELTFPYATDPTDVFTLKTNTGEGYIDQGTGELLVWQAPNLWQRVFETIYMLHTGQGLWWLGLILGAMALGAPFMAVTGVLIWVAARRARPRIKRNIAAVQADTILLVGSEGGSTWGFAATLHAALTAAGHKVHTAPLSGFAPNTYGRAERMVILAATYGDGAAPSSAKGFLDRLRALKTPPTMPVAVLGFGDRAFPDFCAYARDIADLAAEKSWPMLLPMATIDRQSPQEFARFGRDLGAAIGTPLDLAHSPAIPKSHRLTLISRRDYGAHLQTPAAILRFAAPKPSLLSRLMGRGFGRFHAGDLLGVLPVGANVPRFYSLASSTRDGFVEICLSRHPGGLCSGQLINLQPGDTINAFLRPNPDFRPARSSHPVILIGAGTGIGPLAGFIRANTAQRPMHLYFGARHPDSDYFYQEDLQTWAKTGALTEVKTAFSRTQTRSYVQDALRDDAANIVQLMANGAQVLVCGGRDMAAGVRAALGDILAPTGLSLTMIKDQGRYVEDTY